MLRGERGAGRARDRDAKMEVWLVGSPCPHTESLSPPQTTPYPPHPTPALQQLGTSGARGLLDLG